MGRKDDIGKAVRVLSADAVDKAVEQGKAEVGQNIGVVLLRVVVDGVNAEQLTELGKRIEGEVKTVLPVRYPEVKHVDASSILVGTLDAGLVTDSPEDLEQSMRQMFKASGALNEEQIDELVQAAAEQLGPLLGMNSDIEPVDLDEYLDGAKFEVTRPILGR